MNPGPHKLTDADRAELCRRVDLPALLAGDGVDVRRNGAAYVCKLRPDERTASCHVYPPGVGKLGADGWTLKDYGDGWGGDALAYLVDRRGLPFVDAVAELCRLAGWTPPSWGNKGLGAPTRPERRGGPCPDTTPPPRPPTVPTMDPEAQLDAALAFVSALVDLVPDADRQGDAYLAGRGCLPAGGAVGCWVLPADACKTLAARIAAGPEADLLDRAGLLKPAADGKPPRLPWWDRVALLGCYDAAGSLAYFVGRRLEWTDGDRWGKYINQGTAGGAVRWPFNLCALYHAAGRLRCWPVEPDPAKAGDVLLVEGPLDALGAACLGWPAVALLTRLQAHDYADRDGAAARMLEAHLPALRDVRRVRVVPDADPGPKGAEGDALAARLAGWLTFAGVRADVARLVDLVPDTPEGCKDLADVAATVKQPEAERSPAPAAKGTRQRGNG
jgi:hypothetical protein